MSGCVYVSCNLKPRQVNLHHCEAEVAISRDLTGAHINGVVVAEEEEGGEGDAPLLCVGVCLCVCVNLL